MDPWPGHPMDGSMAGLMEVGAWGYSDAHHRIERAPFQNSKGREDQSLQTPMRRLMSSPSLSVTSVKRTALPSWIRNGFSKIPLTPTQEKYKKVALPAISTGHKDGRSAEADYALGKGHL